MNADRIRARAEGKLARAKGAHARKLQRKVGGEVASPVEALTPPPVKKRKAKKVAKKATKETAKED